MVPALELLWGRLHWVGWWWLGFGFHRIDRTLHIQSRIERAVERGFTPLGLQTVSHMNVHVGVILILLAVAEPGLPSSSAL